MMGVVRTIVFDLSEVLIAGLVGVEGELAGRMGLNSKECLGKFGGEKLRELCRGRMTEEEYLRGALMGCEGVSAEEVKGAIRRNFHRKVEGMEGLVEELARTHELVLLSDHGREWVDYIRSVHGFVGRFASVHFSFDMGRTKGEVGTFVELLGRIGREGEECVFVDDNTGNVGRAREAGMRGIVFVGEGELRRELRGLGVIG